MFHRNGNDCQRLRISVAIIAAGLCTAMIISWRLWAGERSFPMLPLWDLVPGFSNPLDKVIFVATLAALGSLAFRIWRASVLLVLGLMLLLAIQDQMRWQPWYYQYFLMLAPLAFVRISKGSLEAEGDICGGVLAFHRIIMIMIYLWGGLHKLHAGFISVYTGSLVQPILENLEIGVIRQMIYVLGYMIPYVEILTGAGLLFRRTRVCAVGAAVATHIIILFLLGPIKGGFSNIVVWPWNLAMIGFVIALFLKVERIAFKPALRGALKYPFYVTLFLLTLAPALFHLGAWDRYLSFNLYSGQQRRVYVRVPHELLSQAPVEWRTYYLDTYASDGHKALSLSRWSYNELNVPMVTEWRTIRQISRYVCQFENGDYKLLFLVEHPHLANKQPIQYTCEEINSVGRAKAD